MTLLVVPGGFGQGVGSPAVAGPVFGDWLFMLSWNLSAFFVLEPQARFLEVIRMSLLLHLTSA